MVQRLSLFGTVSEEERAMTRQCLKSISGTDPHDLHITHEIWEPAVRYDPARASQKVQSSAKTDQYRLFVTRFPSKTYIESYETPEAGKNNKVVSQAIFSSQVMEEDADIAQFMADLGYERKRTLEIRGEQYVLHRHVVVNLFQMWEDDALLDSTNQSVIDAYVDVASVRDLAAVERGTQMLLATQQELRGVLMLRIPSRNAFNTRVPRHLP